jgi:proteasome lid subunit RPN8/RPN11
MLHIAHQYHIDLRRSGGPALARFVAKNVDWEPAREWAWWEALCRKQLTGQERVLTATLEPVWHSTLGAPHVAALGVRFTSGEAEALVPGLGVAYFGDLAQQAGSMLVEKGILETGEVFVYSVRATDQPSEAPAAPTAGFAVTERAPLLTLGPPRSLAELQACALACGAGDAADPPVFIPQAILEEVTELTLRAGEHETGSILGGQLHRDPETGALFVAITVQIPARHTEGTSHKLSFTADTWTAARNDLASRGQDMQILSWYHSHPAAAWCNASCDARQRENCPLSLSRFFSEDDRSVHRAVFGKAYATALVVTHSARGMRYDLYGWRQGRIARRGFHLLPGAEPTRFVDGARYPEPLLETTHEKQCQSHEPAH